MGATYMGATYTLPHLLICLESFSIGARRNNGRNNGARRNKVNNVVVVFK